MDLILWRHAEAEEGDGSLPDHKRRLTPRGEKQAKRMAVWLNKQLPKKARILVSPTERTQQTAHALELGYEIEDRISVGTTTLEHIEAAGWPDKEGTVLLIGHQPTLGRLAALLLAGEEAEWAVKKGGVWWISYRVRDGESQTVLRAVLHPDFL
jgi:phosphohistidine phosphatase